MSDRQIITIIGARVIPGRSRGRKIGVPTINLDPMQGPKNLSHGIYACLITIAGKKHKGAMHYGPRPVFHDTVTLEIHVLDEAIGVVPESVDVTIVGRIRDVQDFSNVEGLQEAIASDISAARAILKAYESDSKKADS